MAGDDKTDNKYDHDITPPPSYDEVQMKNVVKTDKKDEKTEDGEKEKEGDEKTEEGVPPVGMLALVRLSDREDRENVKYFVVFSSSLARPRTSSSSYLDC